MKNRTVGDVMTRAVVLVNDSASFKEIVRRMEGSGVSALPVVDAEERLVGIVSEADLLLKEEHALGPVRWRLFDRRLRRIERAKSEGLVAAQVMTAPVITVGPEASLGQAARLMHQKRVKRLPVLDAEGKVIGIVSRADLLTVFMRPDNEIQREVAERVLIRTLSIGPDRVRTTVRDGVVTVEGSVERRGLISLLTGLVRGVDGVVGVEERLSYEFDDAAVRPDLFTPWGVYRGSERRAARGPFAGTGR
jgi:CBS-domain-containing membrane protein